MVRPYSNDLRERVVSAVAAGDPCRAVAARFGIAVPATLLTGPQPNRTSLHQGQTLDAHGPEKRP